MISLPVFVSKPIMRWITTYNLQDGHLDRFSLKMRKILAQGTSHLSGQAGYSPKLVGYSPKLG
jgi:hypothetical protein